MPTGFMIQISEAKQQDNAKKDFFVMYYSNSHVAFSRDAEIAWQGTHLSRLDFLSSCLRGHIGLERKES